MRVVVEVMGELRRYLPDGHGSTPMDVPDGTTVVELLKLLGVDELDPWNASLNGTLASPSDKLSEGSEVLFFPPISGGEQDG